jgi:hypothetical protein
MRITLTLTLAVTYETNGAIVDVRDLEDNLLSIATRAGREGWLEDGTEAEIVLADPSVARTA